MIRKENHSRVLANKHALHHRQALYSAQKPFTASAILSAELLFHTDPKAGLDRYEASRLLEVSLLLCWHTQYNSAMQIGGSKQSISSIAAKRGAKSASGKR